MLRLRHTFGAKDVKEHMKFRSIFACLWEHAMPDLAKLYAAVLECFFCLRLGYESLLLQSSNQAREMRFS